MRDDESFKNSTIVELCDRSQIEEAQEGMENNKQTIMIDFIKSL
jgi:hypothetical protein